MILGVVMQWPSPIQALADVALVVLTAYTVLSTRSGGLRAKRERDLRMDEFLDGQEADGRFAAIPSAPARLALVEESLASVAASQSTLVRIVTDLRAEVSALARANGAESRRAQARDRAITSERNTA